MPRPFSVLFLVSYDLPSTKSGDRRRARVARYLEGIGLRVQWSVFEVEAHPEFMPRIYRELEDLLDLSEDSIRIYTLCASCAPRAVHIGKSAAVEYKESLVF